MLRGQLTLEYMFLLLLSLALIAISLGALIKIREAGERAYNLALFKSSALNIHNAGEEVCAMGRGNSIPVSVKENVSISQDHSEVIFFNPYLNASFSRNATCEYSSYYAQGGTEISIANDGGKIRIKTILK